MIHSPAFYRTSRGGPDLLLLERHDRRQGGVLELRLTGGLRPPFLRNRIGICVLHPIVECAGKPCRVRHSDGAWKEHSFPRFISPHQPLKDIRALAWSPSERVQANIELEGEVFEMEDQRNWTDASFKTYSTPLELPFPVQLSAGEQIRQRFVLSLVVEHGAISAPEEPAAKIIISGGSTTKPSPRSACPRRRCCSPLFVRSRAFGTSPLEPSARRPSLLGCQLENSSSSS